MCSGADRKSAEMRHEIFFPLARDKPRLPGGLKSTSCWSGKPQMLPAFSRIACKGTTFVSNKQHFCHKSIKISNKEQQIRKKTYGDSSPVRGRSTDKIPCRFLIPQSVLSDMTEGCPSGDYCVVMPALLPLTPNRRNLQLHIALYIREG